MGRGYRGAVLLCAISLALGAGACGGPGQAGVATLSAPTTTTTSPPARAPGGSGAPGGELAAYARCVRAHGVPSFPGPGSLAAAGSIRSFKGQLARSVASLAGSPEFQAAQRACAQYEGPPSTASPRVSAREIQKLLAVSRCVRAHGISDFPDPNPVTGPRTSVS